MRVGRHLHVVARHRHADAEQHAQTGKGQAEQEVPARDAGNPVGILHPCLLDGWWPRTYASTKAQGLRC
jgi:hypothetical protein